MYMHSQRANNPLQGLDRCALTVVAISGSPNLEPSFGAISQVVDLYGRQKAFRESTPVDITVKAVNMHSYVV